MRLCCCSINHHILSTLATNCRSHFSLGDRWSLDRQRIYICNICNVPTADPFNSIKPDQAIVYWSGSVGVSDRVWS